MSAVEVGFEDDFWDSRDSVFVNGFSVSNSLCSLKMSASVIELGILDDFWDTKGSLSSMFSQSPVLYVH